MAVGRHLGWSHSVATRIVLPLRATRLFKKLAMQSESFTCSHCRCLGSYNRNYFYGALFDSKGVIVECAGGRPNTAPQAVCV